MPINYDNWATDKSVAVEIGKEIETGYWKESKLEPLVGRSTNRGIRAYQRKDISPFRPRLKDKMRGSGVRGNTDFQDNYDKTEIFSQTIYPEVIGNSEKSEIQQYAQAKMIDFIKETQDGLTQWFAEATEKMIFASLVNDFTNVVVAGGSNGYRNNPANNTDVRAYCQTCRAGDILEVATLQRAIYMAKNGVKFDGSATFPIKPTAFSGTTEGGIQIKTEVYVIFLSSTAIEQLKKDPKWLKMQEVGIRGDLNRVFTGFAGVIDSCVIVDMGEWSEFSTGLPSSGFDQNTFESFLTNADKTSVLGEYAGHNGNENLLGCLIGASAICYATNETVKFYIEPTDAGRKTVVGGDKVLGISKAKYQTHETTSTSPYNNQDFGVIGIVSSKE